MVVQLQLRGLRARANVPPDARWRACLRSRGGLEYAGSREAPAGDRAGALMGRPTVLDDLVAQRICAAIAEGNTRRCAAQAAGVSVSALKEWMQRGRAGREPYTSFLAKLEKADAEAEAKAVKVITDAALSGTWQSAAWWLERRRRNTWRRPAQEQERPDTSADVTKCSDEQLLAAVEAARVLREKKGAA